MKLPLVDPRRVAAGGLLSACLAVAAPAFAETGEPVFEPDASRWSVIAGPYAHHWNKSSDHKNVLMVGVERKSTDDRLMGLALFRNSFGQPSTYAYYGMEWNNVLGQPGLYLQLTGGLIYGYKGEHANKIPFNRFGLAPVIIPAIGWRLTPKDAVRAALLGNAGVIFTYNRGF